VAYQPGIERQQIENQLGQGVGATLAQLQRRGLIRLDQSGFFTTERFLEVAGIESLDELPKADDL
jgi:chromosome segregation and condensation protein ScpB